MLGEAKWAAGWWPCGVVDARVGTTHARVDRLTDHYRCTFFLDAILQHPLLRKKYAAPHGRGLTEKSRPLPQL